MADLFGFEIRRKRPDQELQSFAPPVKDDGAVVVQEGGVVGTYLDLEGAVRTESELVTRYREMSIQPEIESAIDDIVNEMVAFAEDEDLVQINLDQLEGYSEKVKQRIRKEFEEVVRLFDFNMNGYDLCRRWYIDGRLYFHVIIDEKNPDHGILEMRYIDPRKLRKVREIRRIPMAKGLASTIQTRSEYYIYNERGFAVKESASTAGYTSATGMRIAEDSIVAVTSGLMDPTNTMVLGYLHKAIKPLNQLRAMEDAAVIYRLVRAPERRVFYIDVGSLPKLKAEQYLRDMMVKHKNKVVYDAQSGEIRDDRRYATMMEDFWLPRREGGRGTEIDTLEGGQNLGEMEDVNYFKQRLYHALQVPVSRLSDDGGSFNLGRATEISRDELKFAKFIDRIRLRFSYMFYKTLEKQLILKRVISAEEAPAMFQKIRFIFARDNFFAELKETEILRERVGLLNDIDQYVGKYYSTDWIKRNVLRQDDELIDKMKKEMDEDEVNGQQGDQAFSNMNPDMGGGDGGGPPGGDQGEMGQEPGQQMPGTPSPAGGPDKQNVQPNSQQQ